LAFLLSFAAPDIDVAWTSSVAHRMWDLPNPYEVDLAPPPGSLISPETPMPEPARPPRYFVIEDSADMMGLPLSRNVLVGFQVEFVGPGEEPTGAAKTTRVARDPYHPAFLLPTVGLRLGF